MNIAVSSAALIAAPSIASAREADPIFALIEAHRRAQAALYLRLDEQCALEEELPHVRRQTRVDEWDTIICADSDDPRWIESEWETHCAHCDEQAAACELIAEPPATVAGAIALLRYVAEVEVDGEEFPNGLVESEDQKRGRDFSFYLHKNLATTFAEALAA